MQINFWEYSYIRVEPIYADTWRLDMYLNFPCFEPDSDHIRWLCECHEWLRPYFPLWRGVF